MERERLRQTFEEAPELYERARPTYPDQLFDDLAALAGLGDGARVLEIGCGTGQATLPLARRGYSILCVELGEGLAAAAGRNLAPFPNVDVVHGNFETWEPERAGFDAIVAFTAFHWVDPELRYEKSARLLRESGPLALVGTLHVQRPGGDTFWDEVQEDYDAVVPSDDNRPPPLPEEIDDLRAEIEGSGRFEHVGVRRYVWDLAYSADEYISLLDTYSGHRALDDRRRTRLYDRIRRRVEARPGGSVTKTYLTILNVARKRSEAPLEVSPSGHAGSAGASG
jgi:SAM-dependent methyltransferase